MYSYQRERPNLFTEEGQRMFLKIRDRVKSLLGQAGRIYHGVRIGGLYLWGFMEDDGVRRPSC